MLTIQCDLDKVDAKYNKHSSKDANKNGRYKIVLHGTLTKTKTFTSEVSPT